MSKPGLGAAPATLTVLTTVFALAGPILSLAPLGMAPLMIVAAVVATASERLANRRWPRPDSAMAGAAALLLGGSAASLIWDIDAVEGARKLLDIAAIFIAVLALSGSSDWLTARQQRRLALCLIGGVLAGLALLAVETLFDFPLYRLVKGDDPRLVDLVESKRAVDSLPLLVWPAALALARIGRKWLGVALACGFTAASVKLTASSATIGMMVSLAALALAAASVKAARLALIGVTIVAFAAIIPVAITAYDAGGTDAAWLKRSGQHRVEIWHFAAEKILERPILGYGLNASRHIPNGAAVSKFQEPGKPLIPLHPHDAFLQIWLELGLVGVAIVTALLAMLLLRIGRLPAMTGRFALAGYAAAIVVAGLAFGIWQSWWLATLGFGVAASAMMAPDLAETIDG
jgi:O-antigen ligase